MFSSANLVVQCDGSTYQMNAEWFDAVSSLTAFVRTGDKEESEQNAFLHMSKRWQIREPLARHVALCGVFCLSVIAAWHTAAIHLSIFCVILSCYS